MNIVLDPPLNGDNADYYAHAAESTTRTQRAMCRIKHSCCELVLCSLIGSSRGNVINHIGMVIISFKTTVLIELDVNKAVHCSPGFLGNGTTLIPRPRRLQLH